MPRLMLDLENRIEELGRLAEEVEAFAWRNDVPPAIAGRLVLALDEVVTNVISYAFKDGQPHMIHVELRHEDGYLGAEVVDDGEAFDPLLAPAPDINAALDDRPIGGLGIHFVRKTMDVVRYRRDGNKNRFTVAKAIA